MIKISAMLITLVWFTRFIFNSEMALYTLTVRVGIVFVIFSVPYYSIFYQISQKEKTAVFFASSLKILFIFAGLSYMIFFFWKNIPNKKLIK